MAITQAVASTFKQELMQGLHNFSTGGGNTFKMALYTSAATLDSSTTIYTTSSEIVGTGYTAGGNTLGIPASMPSLTTTTAWTDFNDSTWSTSTITNARGAMIYNSTNGNKTAVILDFGSDKSSSAGDFTVVFPAANSSAAIIRIA